MRLYFLNFCLFNVYVFFFNVVYQLMTKYYTSPTIFAQKIKIIKNSIVFVSVVVVVQSRSDVRKLLLLFFF